MNFKPISYLKSVGTYVASLGWEKTDAKKAIFILIILLGLKWAITAGVQDGTKYGLWNIERSLDAISNDVEELNRSFIITYMADGESRRDMMVGRILEFPPASKRIKRNRFGVE